MQSAGPVRCAIAAIAAAQGISSSRAGVEEREPGSFLPRDRSKVK